jgi:hypothetical protein
MDAPLPHPDALIRPWRTATLVASLVAAVELVLLLAVAFVLLAKPLSRAMQSRAEKTAFAPPHRIAAAAHRAKRQLALPKLLRGETNVLVLNGNGRAGAAGRAAAQLQGLGYRVRSTGNARRQDYATSVVMYRSGYAPEAARLARDLHVKVVGPLDGLKPAALKGAQLAIILGAG